MALRMPFNQAFWEEYLSGQDATLPSLPDTSTLSSRVIRILGGNPGAMHLQGTNTYLVGTGPSRILIDTGQGLPIWLSRIVGVLHSNNISISHILLTHWHGDHTGGVPDLISYNPTLGEHVYKNLPDAGQKPIEDGQIFAVEGATVRAVFTPGHSVDHMCFLLEEENALFTGDNVLGHGFSVAPDLGRYMESLELMAGLGCVLGYPAHGAVIGDLPSKLEEYIRHKEMRVQGILSVLVKERERVEGDRGTEGRRKGGMTLHEIARAMFGTVPDEVIDQAMAPFLMQALWKLTEDRKVGFEPGDPVKRKWFAVARRKTKPPRQHGSVARQ
ncbi:metallo-beta-lactamase type thioesterase nscB [Aspergillus fischeri NRRL 181]|uniref:Lactamase-like protein nscB n=1 Tax=Neosartorya fischeri (strain ATCC 1020 / DSM 3700 / CBS 544.65 / FGSC A1164 / JCM 1740 / NRRL 181 / WB 181) TaxID=331117 RepID=NSCB_NEOFI|nr:metallo-beta-lactamase superfamily protein [Aspergillus fischeri NRRL 181]A1D8J2.1 RecName: Full=Lactamase-like protein nscB; AltName: Full=Neosartoricin biosynthesis protein B [Aspergillus fischeri NRRL 181]EAW20703.1 metallo-beta-lactamase superfamily protein [Aspergillus fischeri NRRL 181]